MTTNRCGAETETTGEPCRNQAGSCPHHGASTSEPRSDLDHLTDKQRRFVEEYTACFNAAEAARRAGYSRNTARQIGCENLAKPDVRSAIDERMKRLSMGADEALKRLTEWARGDIGQVVEITEGGAFTLDLNKAREVGALHLIKELSYDREGRPKVKLYDAKDAVKQIARAHGLFVDKVEHSGEVETSGVLAVPVSPDAESWGEAASRQQKARANGADSHRNGDGRG